MPRTFVVRLEHLCIQSIVYNWEQITSQYEDEEDVFQCLPEYLLHDLRRRLAFSTNLPLNFRDFLCLVSCRSQITVDIQDFIFSKQESLRVLQTLTQRSGRVQNLSLCSSLLRSCCAKILQPATTATPPHHLPPPHQLSPHVEALNIFLCNLPKLCSLTLRMTPCQNWMLWMVAKYCPNLCDIDLTDCTEIDDDGVLAFCDQNDSLYSNFFREREQVALLAQSTEIRFLRGKLNRIWLTGTKVSVNAVVELLLSFPQLQLCHHPDLLKAIYFLNGPNWNHLGNNNYSVELCAVNPLLINIVCHSNWLCFFAEPSTLCESISFLEITSLTSDVDLSCLVRLRSLTALKLASEQKCGANLDVLVRSCPQLRHLSLNVKGPLVLTRSLIANGFEHLEWLYIDSEGSKSLSATDAVRLLVRCTNLVHLRLSSCPWLTDKTLDDLLGRNRLSNTKEIAFYDSKLSYDGIVRLLNLQNNLRLLSVGTQLVGKKHFAIFNDYIRKRNWSLILRLYTAGTSIW